MVTMEENTLVTHLEISVKKNAILVEYRSKIYLILELQLLEMFTTTLMKFQQFIYWKLVVK